MGVTKLSAALRIPLGLGLVGFALAAGLVQRSPWILPFLGAGFTLAYLFGQLRLWRVARNSGTLKRYWLQLPADFALQMLLVSALYLIGFGLRALFSGAVTVAPFGPADAIWPLAAGAAGAIMGLYIDRLEGKPASFMPLWMLQDDEASPERKSDLVVSADPVTLDTFFSGEAGGEGGLSEDDITRVEARLGRALPDTLIELYRRQNGGNVAGLCIPKRGIAHPDRYEHVMTPFGAYNDLVPADSLRTVWDTVCDYADPDDPDEADQFPEGSKAMIVLAQWYRETLFLDYNQPAAPRVGFTDFDRFDVDGEPDPVIWWPDFDAFFASLRHYEPV
jgi:hypothetical protein